MAGITLETAQQRLNDYLAAEAKILDGQEVVVDGRKRTRADLAAVQKGIELWNGRVLKLSRNGRIRIVEVTPR